MALKDPSPCRRSGGPSPRPTQDCVFRLSAVWVSASHLSPFSSLSHGAFARAQDPIFVTLPGRSPESVEPVAADLSPFT